MAGRQGASEPRHGAALLLWRSIFAGLEGELVVATKAPSGSLEQRFFRYPAEAAKAAAHAFRMSDDGREAYACAHLLRVGARTRKKADALEVRALWADLDH